MKWYYIADGQQIGPIDEDTLRQYARDGRLRPTDYVWNPSMPDAWELAGTVPGLFGPAVPPPLPGGPVRIAYWAPAFRAYERTKEILLRPVDVGKWFVLGFVAWLMSLQAGMLLKFDGSVDKTLTRLHTQSEGDPQVFLQMVLDAINQHRLLTGGVIASYVAFAMVLGVVLMWMRARGQFMFLDNVLHNRARIKQPWTDYSAHANSLFTWYLIYAIITGLVLTLLGAAAALTVFMPLTEGLSWTDALPAIAMNAVGWILVGIVMMCIVLMLFDFVVPIMYLKRLTAREAWGRLMPLLRDHTGYFLGYGLFYLLLILIAQVYVLGVILCTLCLAGCLMLVPVAGTYFAAVILLPVHVFFRLFSVEWLAQFGPAFDVLSDVESNRSDPDPA